MKLSEIWATVTKIRIWLSEFLFLQSFRHLKKCLHKYFILLFLCIGDKQVTEISQMLMPSKQGITPRRMWKGRGPLSRLRLNNNEKHGTQLSSSEILMNIMRPSSSDSTQGSWELLLSDRVYQPSNGFGRASLFCLFCWNLGKFRFCLGRGRGHFH